MMSGASAPRAAQDPEAWCMVSPVAIIAVFSHPECFSLHCSLYCVANSCQQTHLLGIFFGAHESPCCGSAMLCRVAGSQVLLALAIRPNISIGLHSVFSQKKVQRQNTQGECENAL